MIIYLADKQKFLKDVKIGEIEEIISRLFKKVLYKSPSDSEKRSWANSLKEIYLVVCDPSIPDNATIAVEYQIPQTSKRIDFIVAGQNQDYHNILILIELKQWDVVKKTDKDGIIKTYLAGGIREVVHPSYQVWSYGKLLEDFNENVRSYNIKILPCVYLHNYNSEKVIKDNFYKDYTSKAPVFLKKDLKKLQEFIKNNIVNGDKDQIIKLIEKSKLRPSKTLADTLVSLLKGNKEFTMIDEQKIVYETVLNISKKNKSNRKEVIIVEGGPGTGKSVVAVNLLVDAIKIGLSSRYVTKNAAPRAVYESMLTGTFKRSQISNLFCSSGAFIDTRPNEFDLLIVDEAHRLNEKSGIFQNLGENQIKEIINSAKNVVFFIDEDQRITLKDIGTKEEIKKWAEYFGANITEMELSSQFRCKGSDGYIAWLDNTLQIRETANKTLEGIDYDFKVFDDPQELYNAIKDKNNKNNKARLVAGYCWDWISKKPENKDKCDIEIGKFKIKWNLTEHGSLWLLKEESINEAGCIHTCQGLELDYIGVIIGPDLIVRNDKVITLPEKRAKTDASLKGYKKLYKENPEFAKKLADRIIKNTYKTLMSRGIKGCYIYCVDKETNEYFKRRAKFEKT